MKLRYNNDIIWINIHSFVIILYKIVLNVKYIQRSKLLFFDTLMTKEYEFSINIIIVHEVAIHVYRNFGIRGIDLIN